MNKLEETILDATVSAQKLHIEMSGGEWLDHAPESFLQHVIARKIYCGLGNEVYIDASGKRVAGNLPPRRGRRPHVDAQRADISVWYKRKNKLCAIIEIKKANELYLVKSDVDKLKNCLEHEQAAKTGYLLVYSEILRENRRGDRNLEVRFNRWAEELTIPLVGKLVREPSDELWSWGAALFKIQI